MLLLPLLSACSVGYDTMAPEAAPTPTESGSYGACAEDPEPPPRLLRRLTHGQYDASVQAVLATDQAPGEAFAPDDVSGWFDNHADALKVSALLADQYRSTAEALAAQAPLEALLPCDPDLDGPSACALQFIDEVGYAAFRRPLAETDLLRYHGLWSSVASEDGFSEGLRWVLTAMLQSPHFLYRMELGEPDGGERFRLTDWELASVLSYTLWDSPPDTTLMAAAAAGELQDVAGRADQVARMRDDPRLADQASRFVDDWLHLDQLAYVAPDADAYPGFTDTLRDDMRGETHRLVADVVRTDGTLADLILAEQGYRTDALADWYDLPAGNGAADADGFREVTLDGDTDVGLFTQGSLLTTHALPESSSPVHRGVVIRERVLCQELAPPPPNQDVSTPPVDPDQSTRDRFEQHTSDPACTGCHDLIDPLGFGFESYDGVGRWRTDDEGHAIDDSGAITATASSNGTFSGVRELSEQLAASPDVGACVVEMWLTWATGQDDQECAAEALFAGTTPAELGLVAPLEALLAQEGLSLRAGDADALGTPATGARVDLDVVSIDDDGDYADPVPDPLEGLLEWTLTESGSWGDGYCSDGVVTNLGAEVLTWSFSTEIRGEIDNLWGAVTVPEGDALRFSGDSWNTELAAGSSTTFGFCAVL